MDTEFYKLPPGILHQLSSRLELGNVLAPYDPDGQLGLQIRQQRIEVETFDRGAHVFDPLWWANRRNKFDWVIANTTGLKTEALYILDYGIKAAMQGVIILDRLSFLEPVAKRRNFLRNNKLSDVFIFSPRPQFSTVTKTKDSVTSAWFVFRSPENWNDGTNIEYLVDWQATPPLPDITSESSRETAS